MFEGLFQPMHLLVILFIAILVFGPKRLPEIGKGLGQAIRGFKDAMEDGSKKEESQSKQVEPSDAPQAHPEPDKRV